MDTPLVSVIVPVYNGEAYIEDALASIQRQDYAPIEIIVIDDGSTDGTAEIVQGVPEVRYFHQANSGPAAARNRGIERARGEVIAFLDADDLWTPHKLSTQVKYLFDHPDIQYTIAQVTFFLEPGYAPPPGFRPELLEGRHVGRIMGTFVAHTSVFDLVGLFDPDFATAEDVDWFARANNKDIPMAIIPEVLLHKRVHDANLTYPTTANNQNLLQALKQSIDRQHRKRQINT